MENKLSGAAAVIKGGAGYPDIKGTVSFTKRSKGVLVTANICGLPTGSGKCGGRVFGFHIHEGTSCTGNADDPFADTKGHYNPSKCDHPNHAGDMPPLFGCNGYAYLSFVTDRFSIDEIIGKTVVIHDMPDDFKTQPSGGSGGKIACGNVENRY